jgi:NADPH:quinone reductase-like Zn-dependent oxidoreductase
MSSFENEISSVDIVIDTVGGETRARSIKVLKPGGSLISAVSPFNQTIPNIRTAFFIVEVTTARLNALTDLFERRELSTQIGSVLTLDQVRTAHEMLAGAPHERGKILLNINASAPAGS